MKTRRPTGSPGSPPPAGPWCPCFLAPGWGNFKEGFLCPISQWPAAGLSPVGHSGVWLDGGHLVDGAHFPDSYALGTPHLFRMLLSDGPNPGILINLVWAVTVSSQGTSAKSRTCQGCVWGVGGLQRPHPLDGPGSCSRVCSSGPSPSRAHQISAPSLQQGLGCPLG